MSPQIGDIWEYKNPDYPFYDGAVLPMEETKLFYIEENAISFKGIKLDTGECGDFLFREENLPFWKRLV